MATRTASLAAPFTAAHRATAITLCHCTLAHSQLKSRTYHRICLPLAEAGFRIRYVSPARVTDHPDGIEFVRIPAIKNRFGMLSRSSSVLRELLRQDAAIYHFQDPELLPIAFALKILFGRRVIYDAYEDFPSMAAATKTIPRALRALAKKLVDCAENLAARSFDAITTADPFTLRRLAHTGKCRKAVFYNFPNLDFFPRPRPSEKLFDIVYRGGLSDRAGTFTLLDALHRLKSERRSLRMLLIGYFDNSGSQRAIDARIDALELRSNVEILGRIDHESMAKTLTSARIGVCPLDDVPKFLLNIPVKVFEYWACGLPVVSTDLPPIRPFLRHGEAGLLCRPHDPEELAQSIARLLDHPETAIQMGIRGREFVESRLNNQREIHKLFRLCSQIARAPQTADEEALAPHA